MAVFFTNVGRGITTNRVKNGDTGATEPSYLGWGTGATAAAATSTTLSTESGSRSAGTSTQQTTTETNDTYQVIQTLTSAAGETITNAGLFDASSGGNLYMIGDFTGVVLAASDSIQFTMKVQYT